MDNACRLPSKTIFPVRHNVRRALPVKLTAEGANRPLAFHAKEVRHGGSSVAAVPDDTFLPIAALLPAERYQAWQHADSPGPSVYHHRCSMAGLLSQGKATWRSSMVSNRHHLVPQPCSAVRAVFMAQPKLERSSRAAHISRRSSRISPGVITSSSGRFRSPGVEEAPVSAWYYIARQRPLAHGARLPRGVRRRRPRGYRLISSRAGRRRCGDQQVPESLRKNGMLVGQRRPLFERVLRILHHR